MSDKIVLGDFGSDSVDEQQRTPAVVKEKTDKTLVIPELTTLKTGLEEAGKLVDDIVLKKYLHKLSDLDVIPLDDSLKNIGDIRLFKITEMVYQNNEYSIYKFASVFNAVQNLNCGVFIVIDSDGRKTEFYMGVRSLDNMRTTKLLKDTLRNALNGQFPGVKTEDLLDSDAQKLLSEISDKNIAAVSCVAANKDEEIKDNNSFVQGLEKLAFAMQGQRYTAVILAKSSSPEQLDEIRGAYENIYTQLSPFANMQMSYGKNTALSISDALSKGTSFGTSYSENVSVQHGTSDSTGTSQNRSESRKDNKGALLKRTGQVLLGAASVITAPLTGGASLAVAGGLLAGSMVLDAYEPKTVTQGSSTSQTHTENHSTTQGETKGTSETKSENITHTSGSTSGSSETIQLTIQNRALQNTLERINHQLERIDECESIGMWECAAYFLSDTRETAEMAAGTYKALMKGEGSGVETSSVSFWGRQSGNKLLLLRDYITSFIHPVFKYDSDSVSIPVTAASLVSSNELAIQMGLPRKSICGLPVIEHADFGKETVCYNRSLFEKSICLGKIYCMGKETAAKVQLDCNSLTMHTFITGSTGAGKSNTIYEILSKLKDIHNIPFLVIEPAKGEYKNVFGKYHDVKVYGTNPKKTELLKINPFRFPKDVHVLEHLDRLVEIFNVCWPMYAAMPAILKDAMEKAYVEAGWDLVKSENPDSGRFPNFKDLLEKIEKVIDESKYSGDSKGDYSGALLTRVRSLTNGLNGLIFSNNDISDEELFDKNVIVDLSRVGSAETKSLIMGLLVMKLNEYRMCSGKINSPLSHITVLEEAHNILRRTPTDQTSEGSNLLGKSVEMLANSIAEMRTYGEGFIIADQSPGLMDMSVIRNTNTKIIMRLPDKSDRELVGYSAGLVDDQVDELAKLGCGIAAVYQNDWIEPVLVKINKSGINETAYNYNVTEEYSDNSHIITQIVNLLIQGRLNEKLDFSVSEIKNSLDMLELSSANYRFVKAQLEEYSKTNALNIWNDENFAELSEKICTILNVRGEIEQAVMTVADNERLTETLASIAGRLYSSASKAYILTLSQCFVKDMSVQQGDEEIRRKIYQNWVDYVRKGGKVL